MSAKDKLTFLNKLSKKYNRSLTFDDIETIQNIQATTLAMAAGFPNRELAAAGSPNRESTLAYDHYQKGNIYDNSYDHYRKGNIYDNSYDHYRKGNIYDNSYDTHERQRMSIGRSEENDKTQVETQIAINNQINISDIMGLSTQNDLINLANPAAGYASRIVVLDSLYQDDTVNGSGKIAWDLIPSRDLNNMTSNGIASGNPLSGANTSETLKNIVGIRLMPFRLLVVNDVDYGYKFNYDPLFTWTVLIEELQSQAVIGPTGRKYHFMTTLLERTNSNDIANISTANYWEMTTHNYNQGYFWFRKPITELSRITLSFGCPWYQFNIKNSKFTTGIVNYTNLLAALINITPTWNNLNQGNLGGNLTITGFTTANPTTDAALISYVNSTTFTTSMYSSTVVTISSVNYNLIRFSSVSLAGITLVANSQMNIYTDIYRMIFPLEIIYKNDAVKLYT